MAAFLDACRFLPTAGGTADWTYSSTVGGYQAPSAAGAVNGTKYKYRAESADLTQWELGEGTWNSSTGVLSRTTVLFNSSGTTSKINFSTVPQVAVVALAEDLVPLAAPSILQSAPGVGLNPASVTQGSGFRMMGMGSTISFTPKISQRIKVTLSGTLVNDNANGQALAYLCYGTGTAPSNGTSATGIGTQIGAQKTLLCASANQTMAWTQSGIVTGLTLGQAIWIDVALGAANVVGSHASIQNVDYTIEEVI